jgi:hypothetical protein
LSYRVQKKRNRYAVIEKGSEFVIATFNLNKDARELCRGLNLGQGFDGHTPEFFIQEFKSIKKATTV